MKSFNICLAIAVIRSTIVAAIGDTIPCICNSGLPKGNEGDCNQWCGDACLNYLREELLIMDLAHCLDSTVCLHALLTGDGIDTLANYLRFLQQCDTDSSAEDKARGVCNCSCKSVRQVSQEP